MTIEMRTDYLWGLIEGEPKVLDPGTTINRGIVLDYDYKTTQVLRILTPDIVQFTEMYLGKPVTHSLHQGEINNNSLAKRDNSKWEQLRGKKDVLHWTPDDGIRGKKITATQPTKLSFSIAAPNL